MLRSCLREHVVRHILPKVQTPAQYLGGEVNSVAKDAASVRGRLCLAFPDTYTIGMSHHGLQVLYSLMNDRPDWACERSFTPWPDMERELRAARLPLYGWESFTPLCDFDVVGFTLQYEISAVNVLTMLDLGGIPLRSEQRGWQDPLVIAGGPCAQNPEPLAAFIDVFVPGDGEGSLPALCDHWLQLRRSVAPRSARTGAAGRRVREQLLGNLAAALPYCYVPRFYEPEYHGTRQVALHRLRPDVPATVTPWVVSDLDAIPLPRAPIVPHVETVHDRIAIEIMRGCPWQCRFCQSTVIKRPLRVRRVETIVQAALDSYRATGLNEVSLLSLSSSDYPDFPRLVRQLQEQLLPLNVNLSVPSLRVNEQLRSLPHLIGNRKRSALTLAPEVARDDMRAQIRKKIRNEDLYEGCRQAFRHGFESVKLYFMCGLPGERPADLAGIVEMAETIARLGREVRGRAAKVTASVSNFVPKAHTPFQWNGMQHRAYFLWAHRYLWQQRTMRSVNIKCHDIDTSLLEGVISRGDRRTARAIELAWQRGARLDGWQEQINPARWWQALADAGIDVEQQLHAPYPLSQHLPWDHLKVKYGRDFLVKEQSRSQLQLETMTHNP